MTTDHTADLACRELVEIITNYLEGALSDADRTRFEAHLARCQGCRRYVEQMRATIAAAGRITPNDLGPESRERLRNLFRGWAAPK